MKEDYDVVTGVNYEVSLFLFIFLSLFIILKQTLELEGLKL